MAQSKSDEMYGIRPMSSRNSGWRVCIVRCRQEFTRCFSVARYGTLDAALAAAQQWRDEVVRSAPAMRKAEYSDIVRRNNTSGHSGVFLRRQTRHDASGRLIEHVFWQAQTPEGVRPFRSRSFAIKKFGFEKAYALAVEAREAFVADLGGALWLGRRTPSSPATPGA